ncbi:MAG TPA: 5-formyltetrahydrofolate cyclo-ligase [Xanthobacteraceae bacterium]|nr:5-formyltetrahydrofolate cyclo-ligase [Xanthobacteraceae bacterium]
MTDVASEKKQMRFEAIALRDALPREARQDAAEAIAARPFPLKIRAGVIVSGFMPMKSEINPLPLLRRLEEMGARIALPVIGGRGKPLVMRQWSFGEPLAAGVWGIREPKPEASEVDPDMLLVPLLAFDRAGYRVGYGGGYYDMTVTALRAKKQVTAIGIAFAAQEVGQVPRTERDVRLDLVLTETEIIDLRGR